MYANLTAALNAIVTHLDNEGRMALLGAVRDAASEHFDWAERYPYGAEGRAYHRDHWRELDDTARWLEPLVKYETV